MRGPFLQTGMRAKIARSSLVSKRTCVRAVNGADSSVVEQAATVAPAVNESGEPRYFINEIPQSRWANGIPPVMGAHMMPSGEVAPISTSTGPNMNVTAHCFQYHTAETDVQVVQFLNFDGAAQGLVQQVAEASEQAIEAKGSFTVTLSGGSMLKALAKFADAKGIDFSKWWVFFVDERNVPHSSDDSTFKGANAQFLSKVGIPAEQVFAIHENLPVDKAAVNYEGRMVEVSPDVLPRNEAGLPVFDCMLLGVGPDAHVASLFPNSPVIAEHKRWVMPVHNSPKPPAERITMTMDVINASKQCIFLATGAGKADVVGRVLECQSLPGAMPAQLVRPEQGSVTWLLDVESSSELRLAEWDNKKAYPRSDI